MTAWLLSVAGVGILGVLIGHLTAKTRLHGVIKTACTYIFLLVLIFPLPTLISGGFDMTSCSIFDGDFSYNESVMDATEKSYFAVVGVEVDRTLKDAGYETKSEVRGRLTDSGGAVESVTVTLKGEQTDSAAAALAVKSLVAEYLEIDVGAVQVIFE